jgi:hypothetical protein
MITALSRENEEWKREEALEQKPSWCIWLTLVLSWGESQHRQAQLMSLKQDSLLQPQKPDSITSQTRLENLGRNKHCYPSPWSWQWALHR